MTGLRYRESLPAATLDELEALVAGLRAFLLTEHNEDGTHRQGVWQSYQVRWTLADGTIVPVGNGTLTGRYMRVGRTVFYAINLIFGSSTSAGSGTWFFSVPVPATKDLFNVGTAIGIDSDPGGYYPAVSTMSRGQTTLNVTDANGPWDASTPVTWADGDGLIINGSYEISDEIP